MMQPFEALCCLLPPFRHRIIQMTTRRRHGTSSMICDDAGRWLSLESPLFFVAGSGEAATARLRSQCRGRRLGWANRAGV